MKNLISFFKNPKTISVLASLVAILLVAGGAFTVLRMQKRVLIENSTVSSPIISLAPMMPGKLKTILVNDGDRVKKGDAVAQVGTEIVRAYTDGVIIDSNHQTGSLVSSAVPVVKMVDSSQFRIDGVVDENKGLGQIKVGQPVSFTVDAIPNKTFWGYVDEVSGTAKQTQVTFSISSERPVQQFDVYAKFDAIAYPEIKNGMSAKMTVFTN